MDAILANLINSDRYANGRALSGKIHQKFFSVYEEKCKMLNVQFKM